MSLVNKQAEFAQMVALLLLHANQLGYQVTLGDAFRDERVKYGKLNSLHRKRLAIDLNLFKNGRYLSKTEDHKPLGDYWESIGGSWGGWFDDGNHYSLEHEGVK
jgi:hypothetical protein